MKDEAEDGARARVVAREHLCGVRYQIEQDQSIITTSLTTNAGLHGQNQLDTVCAAANDDVL